MKLTDAQIARVRSLEDPVGRLTADRVVEDAKQEDSPLHGLFEWDTAKAAAAHWIQQAREIIGSVEVVIVNKTTTVNVSAYVRDPANGAKQGYASVQALREDPAQARRSLVYTLDVAAGHLRRALELAGPLGLADEVDAMLTQIMGVSRSIAEKAKAA